MMSVLRARSRSRPPSAVAASSTICRSGVGREHALAASVAAMMMMDRMCLMAAPLSISRLLRYGLFAAGVGVLIVVVREVGVVTIADLLRRIGSAFAIVPLLYVVHITIRAAALWRCLATTRFAEVLKVRLSGEAIETLTFTGPFLRSRPRDGCSRGAASPASTRSARSRSNT